MNIEIDVPELTESEKKIAERSKEEIREKAKKVIRKAEKKDASTCDDCGVEMRSVFGHYEKNHSWTFYQCDECKRIQVDWY